MNTKKGPLSSEEIQQMFLDFDLDTEQKRKMILDQGTSESKETSSTEQVFIRIESTTDLSTENK